MKVIIKLFTKYKVLHSFRYILHDQTSSNPDIPFGNVEREVEVDCGRLLFLDRKAVERLVVFGQRCLPQDDGTLVVEIELACRERKHDIEAWAEFFDERGRGVNRTRDQEHDFRKGHIRLLRFSSGLPATQVVVFVEDD